MKNNKKSLGKIIILFIVILIPILGATFIGVYSYNRYQDDYFFNYMRETEETAEARINSYLRYTSFIYEEKPYFTEDIMKDGERVLTFTIFRGTQADEKLYYYFAVYNIDYEKIIEIEDPTGEKKLLYNNIPGFYVRINDANNSITEPLGSIREDVLISDYDSSPEKDSRGSTLTSRFVKWYAYEADGEFSENVEIELFLSRNIQDGGAREATIETFTFADFVNDFDKLNTDTFVQGYEDDFSKAGYFSYVFKTKIWWQSLIALLLVGLISFSFYAVWTVEEAEDKRKR